MRFLVFVALLGAVLASPKPSIRDFHPNSGRIVGGVDTTIEKHPYTAAVLFGWFATAFSQFCGGSIITNRAIVSAAHCFDGYWPDIWHAARVGSSLQNSGGTIHFVDRIVVHEQYDQPTSVNNDVAIMWLFSTITLGPTVATISIAGPNFNLPDNTLVTIIGWGHTSVNGVGPTNLQEVDVYTVNQELCAERYAHLKTQPGFERFPDVTDEMFCAGILDVGGKDACQGDSGGPVVHNGNVLYGIVSWGFECADAFYPGVKASIPALSDWIVRNAP